ncbi:MAG: helix-turn-helix domain-containing protein [Acidimicrobiales bacterium]
MASSPIVARWELSLRLGAKRKELNLDVKSVTDAAGFSRNYWSAVENDRTLIADDKLRILIDLLQFDDDEAADLLELREAARRRGWWEDFPTFDEAMTRFVGLEDGASHIRSFEGLLIPGLLQAPAYSRCVIESDPVISSVETDRALQFRGMRQRRLTGADRVHYSAIMSEAALRQHVGDREVQIEQLSHLTDLIERYPDSIEVRVLPFSRDPGMIVNSSTLNFFDYARKHLPTVAFQEAVRALGVIEYGDRQFRRLELAWMEGKKRSLDRDESLTLIEDVAASMSG